MLHWFWTFAGVSGLAFSATLLQPPQPQPRAILEDHENGVEAIAFSPDSKLLAVGCRGPKEGVKIWDVAKTKCIKTLDGFRSGVDSVAFSPDGKSLAVGPRRGLAWMYDVATWTKGRSFEAGKPGNFRGIFMLSFSPDGKTLMTSDYDKVVTLWNAASGEKIATIPHDFIGVAIVASSADGKNVALAGYGKAMVWSLAEKKVRWQLEGHERMVKSLAFSPDSKLLVSLEYRTSTSGGSNVFLWDMETGKRKSRLDANKRFFTVNAAAFSSDGKTIAVVGDDKISFWRVATAEYLREIKVEPHGASVTSLGFSPDGQTMAVGLAHGDVVLFDVPKK